MFRLTILAVIALLFFPGGQGGDPALAAESGPTVFAAASLKDALDEVNEAWEVKTGQSARISYAASSALAKQIAQGAPADIFLSADRDWMNFVEKTGKLKPATRRDLLANRIALIAPRKSDTKAEIGPDLPLKDMLGDGRLAMADVNAVPAGKYGKAALQSLGLWGGVKSRVAQAQNVRAALALVARGEAPLGIVYSTDARAEPRVRIVGMFPDESHPPIVYPVAELADTETPSTTEFAEFLRGKQAAAIFREQGFSVLSVE